MNKLKNKKILITGGAGLIGSYIADQLMDESVREIVIIDNFTRGLESNLENSLKSGKVKVVRGDIKNRSLLIDLMKGIDYCFHMAAIRITQCASDPQEVFETLYRGTFNVLQACIENKVKKLIAASSASIYGMAEEFPTKETHHPYNNRTIYGAGKMANELMMRSFYDMYGLNYVALRFFNVYGSRMDAFGKYTEVLIRWYRMLKEGKRPKIFGNGKQTMDFVYVEDVARACILGLKSEATDAVFNVASGKETSLEELCSILIKVMNLNIEPEYIALPEERKKVEVTRRLADIGRSQKMLDFKAKVGLEDGLKKLVTWLDNLK